jgi:hypothetical protein
MTSVSVEPSSSPVSNSIPSYIAVFASSSAALAFASLLASIFSFSFFVLWLPSFHYQLSFFVLIEFSMILKEATPTLNNATAEIPLISKTFYVFFIKLLQD